MTNLVAQLPALLGVLVGALATYLLSGAGERARWRREEGMGLKQLRIDSYSRYADAVKTTITLSLRVLAARGVGGPFNTDGLDLEEARRALRAAEAERSETWERVLLLGDPETIAAGREFHEAAWDIQALCHLAEPPDYEACKMPLAKASEARSVFHDHARKSLGIGGEKSPRAAWPRRNIGGWLVEHEPVPDAEIVRDAL